MTTMHSRVSSRTIDVGKKIVRAMRNVSCQTYLAMPTPQFKKHAQRWHYGSSIELPDKLSTDTLEMLYSYSV